MQFIGDFHIHSHYSLATSKNLTPDYLDYWAKIKGINVIGTGDFTHPAWLNELKEKLRITDNNLYQLKNDYKIESVINNHQKTCFIPTAEISTIYKKTGKVRKVHNIIFAPNFEIVEKINNKLLALKFNLSSDGRPIIGLDSRDLLEICLDVSEEIFFVPAHIWTPWFSALGSKSGFDSIEECYGDLSSYISAVETGLSTNSPLNWMCSFLDKYTLMSNSDAHSPEKIGRNANIFNTEISYSHIISALKNQKSNDFIGTIDMFPQEGKYHYDGHRKCNICWSPMETIQNKGICPVCKKTVVVGVVNRIAELSDRVDLMSRPYRKKYYSIIPLKEILSELLGVGVKSKIINKTYFEVLQKTDSELNVLINKPIDEIKKKAGQLIADAIQRMRNNQVYIKEGFDGEFGKVKIFENETLNYIENKKNIFTATHQESKKISKYPLLNFDLNQYTQLKNKQKNNTIKNQDKQLKLF